VVRDWLGEHGGRDLAAGHIWAAAGLATDWRGQGPLDLPGVRVSRTGQWLRCTPVAR
jgi:tRNA(Ile)-lysidine synthase